MFILTKQEKAFGIVVYTGTHYMICSVRNNVLPYQIWFYSVE